MLVGKLARGNIIIIIIIIMIIIIKIIIMIHAEKNICIDVPAN